MSPPRNLTLVIYYAHEKAWHFFGFYRLFHRDARVGRVFHLRLDAGRRLRRRRAGRPSSRRHRCRIAAGRRLVFLFDIRRAACGNRRPFLHRARRGVRSVRRPQAARRRRDAHLHRRLRQRPRIRHPHQERPRLVHHARYIHLPRRFLRHLRRRSASTRARANHRRPSPKSHDGQTAFGRCRHIPPRRSEEHRRHPRRLRPGREGEVRGAWL